MRRGFLVFVWQWFALLQLVSTGGMSGQSAAFHGTPLSKRTGICTFVDAVRMYAPQRPPAAHAGFSCRTVAPAALGAFARLRLGLMERWLGRQKHGVCKMEVSSESETKGGNVEKYSKHGAKFQDMLDQVRAYSLGQVMCLEDDVTRKIITGLVDGAKIPEVETAFRILYEDYPPIRLAGSLLFDMIERAIDTCPTLEWDDETGQDPLTEGALRNARNLFSIVDQDGSGSLDETEVRSFLSTLADLGWTIDVDEDRLMRKTVQKPLTFSAFPSGDLPLTFSTFPSPLRPSPHLFDPPLRCNQYFPPPRGAAGDNHPPDLGQSLKTKPQTLNPQP